MTKRKTSKSTLQTATKDNRENEQQLLERISVDILNSSEKAAESRTEKIKADSILSNYPDIDEYLDNFEKDKKYLLLQGGTKKLQVIIFEHVRKKIKELDLLRCDDYDYQSCRIIDCSSANDDDEILDMIYDDYDEDRTSVFKMLAMFLKRMLEIKKDDSQNNFDTDQIINEMTRRFGLRTSDDFSMAYAVKNKRNRRNGGFTLKGITTIADNVNAKLKSKPSISEKTLLANLMTLYNTNQFTKLKAVLLLDISSEHEFGVGLKGNEPDILFAAMKKGENVKDLSRTFKNKNLFELVELDGDKAVVDPLIKGTTQKVKSNSRVITPKGCKPRHQKYDGFMEIIRDILKDDKKASLGGYVIKVKADMERKDLKDEKKKNGLIYADTTIKTYIQNHSEYKKIQERKG
jgi:hypothetical protein